MSRLTLMKTRNLMRLILLTSLKSRKSNLLLITFDDVSHSCRARNYFSETFPDFFRLKTLPIRPLRCCCHCYYCCCLDAAVSCCCSCRLHWVDRWRLVCHFHRRLRWRRTEPYARSDWLNLAANFARRQVDAGRRDRDAAKKHYRHLNVHHWDWFCPWVKKRAGSSLSAPPFWEGAEGGGRGANKNTIFFFCRH